MIATLKKLHSYSGPNPDIKFLSRVDGLGQAFWGRNRCVKRKLTLIFNLDFLLISFSSYSAPVTVRPYQLFTGYFWRTLVINATWIIKTNSYIFSDSLLLLPSSLKVKSLKKYSSIVLRLNWRVATIQSPLIIDSN